MTAATTGYDLAAFTRATTLSNAEVVARFGVIFGGAIGCGLGLGLWVMVFWALSYAVCIYLYGRMLMAMPPGPVSPANIRRIIIAEAISMIHWPLLFGALWLQETAVTWVLNALILAATMTNAMSARSEDLILRWADRGLAISLLTLSVVLFARQGFGVEQTLVMAGVCLLMYIWLHVSVRDVSRMRLRLTQVEHAALDQQRIEAIGRLTGGVAHDFNNILTVIGGNLDLMREVGDDREKAALLAEARAATGRAAAVTAQLLAYSRQSVLSPAPVDLAACARRVEAFLTRLLPVNVRLVTQIGSDLPVLDIDATRLESALINLILNARDAMPDGGIVTLTVQQVVDGGGQRRVVLAVADTGTGIDPAILARVAEPYFTTKGPGKGSGLGLSMAKGFAEQSGGRMAIRSVIGSGTVVELSFPVA
jgi:two-component system, cell cycle sensor histidine kinase and response regulator CckA